MPQLDCGGWIPWPRKPEFGEPIHAMPVPASVLSAGHVTRDVHWDQVTDGVALTSKNGPTVIEIDGLRITSSGAHDYAILPRDGRSARAGFQFSETYERDDWSVRIETDTQVIRKDVKLVVRSRATAHEGAAKVFAREWVHEFDY